jgi:hypothetical protein
MEKSENIMTLVCHTLRSQDPIAARLCHVLSEDLGVDPLKFDGQERKINYASSGAMPQLVKPNGKLEPAEPYQVYIENSHSNFVSDTARAFFKRRFGHDVQWKLNKIHMSADSDIKKLVTLVNSRAEQETKTSKNDSLVYARANALLHMLRTPKAQGGLGMEYRRHIKPEADINTAIKRGYVRCSEFQTVYYGIGLLLGLKMYPVEVPQMDEKRNDKPHGAIMIVDEASGERFFADMEYEDVQREPPYEEYYVGTSADLFSTYRFNRSMRRVGNEVTLTTARDTPLHAAEIVSPNNAVILFGKGVYHRKRKEWKQAIHYFRRTVEVRKNHIPALSGLCLLTFDKKICDRLPKI